MTSTLTRRWWLGLLGFVWIGMSGQAHAQGWQNPPIKVDTVFQFKIDVKFGPEVKRPTSPWYAYFPADPRMTHVMQTSPYPTWPMQFPPTAPPADAGRDPLKKLSAEAPMMPQWPTYQASAPSVQPIGYVPNQAPSYWYQGR
jgi:hypothetical protein